LSDKGKSVTGHLFDAIEEANKRGWLDKIKEVFRKRHQVIVLGTTGTRKTNFLESLKTSMPLAIDTMNRTEFVEKNRINVDREPFTFIDTPGQVGHQARRAEAVRQVLKGGATGIINIVSYGYHEYTRPQETVFDANGAIREDFLEEHCAVELEALKDWNELLGDPTTSPYLITVVSKADLWWDKHEEVIQYYQNGEYFQVLGGAKNLNPVVLPYCAVFHKFYGRGPMTGMVDDADRQKMRTNLVHHLLMAVMERGGRT
jgi:hypothetical protein